MKSFVLGILFMVNVVGFTLFYLRVKRISSALKTLSFDDVMFLKLFFPKEAKEVGKLLKKWEEGKISDGEFDRGLEEVKKRMMLKDALFFLGSVFLMDLFFGILLNFS